ncbi:exo-beta-N-acetylmuramidase NamZ family protein [Pedobacter nyackensis]|uniref:Uncharacterized conserved protein YbbC, DUF1343 family n=1 Tax=Pedobacter nyackensis TaxID=475255 RepID=A0A1W2D3J3_9SPHI|nr:DUF1343 domain-containing protein [Pedobacter nyackensis]SMC91618.1 Uncharacterized conserved protein YbbC, DUF1343 family [Pedobacter nyackensis]
MVRFGADVLIAQNPDWKKQRIALVTNTAATTNQYEPVSLALLKAGFNLVKLFSPEHGFNAKGADGVKMQDGVDQATQLPVISLYGDHFSPTKTDLQDVDRIMFDIPDVGVRFYTYLWTLTYVLQASADYNKPLIILDRPNPISGNLELCEGPMLNEQYCSSFIGRWNIPLRHSCTLAELALFFNTTKNINADLTVIQCENWDRNKFQPEWDMDFLPTSPAIRNINAAMLYPGLGLLEATNISEGRGTSMPFEIAASPWMNDLDFLEEEKPDGVRLESIRLKPNEGKYASQDCLGVQFTLKEYDHFKSVYHGLLLIKLIKDHYPAYFKWSTYPTNVNPEGTGHLDKLLGLPQSEAFFELPVAKFKATMIKACDATEWPGIIKPYLLY